MPTLGNLLVTSLSFGGDPPTKWLLAAVRWLFRPASLLVSTGNLLVSDGQTNEVKRYDRTTGAFIDVFASTNLSGPMGMTIHDGVLYVANSGARASRRPALRRRHGREYRQL